MHSDKVKRGSNLIDLTTGCVKEEILSDDCSANKLYAVIVRCGHCGDGYFIPLMMISRGKDIHAAIESAKITPKVQRHKKDCVLGAFEITHVERAFIEYINDHDPYMRGYGTKKDDVIQERRVYSFQDAYTDNKRYNENLDGRSIRTEDEYHPFYVLERYFAPKRHGNSIMPASRKIDRDALIREYMYQNTIRYGIKKGNSYLLALYYQQFGENNDLGLEYHNGYITYVKDGKKYTKELRPKTAVYLDEMIENEKLKKEKESVEERIFNVTGKPKNSAMDRFFQREANRQRKYPSIVQESHGAPERIVQESHDAPEPGME